MNIIVRKAAFPNLRPGKSGWFALVLLAGCSTADGAPAGQVVAKVNGEDVTLSALRTEIAASGRPEGLNDAAAVKAALQRMIDRTLLAQSAREQGLDRSREFLLARQRDEREGLAALAEGRVASRLGPPGRAEIDRFIAANPSLFGSRKLFVLDQIRFPRPASLAELSYLEPARTLDEVAAALRQHGVMFERAPGVMDSAGMNPRIAARIDALPPGEVFVLTTGDAVLANEIRERRPAAVPAEAARRSAALLLGRRETGRAVETHLAALRRSAEISYQPGYAPAPRGNAGGR